ncbi:MAG: hypothetical protein K8L97_31175 [Anaerolineae bacterium]|nr:hypothetical protein [Anaerolineae bacterium]
MAYRLGGSSFVDSFLWYILFTNLFRLLALNRLVTYGVRWLGMVRETKLFAEQYITLLFWIILPLGRFDILCKSMIWNYAHIFLNTLKVTLDLLTSDGFSKLLGAIQLRIPFLSVRPGFYEVLEQHVRLELLDVGGKKAVYYKQQKVRFLQDNVIAYQDKAWGTGNIFADYKCSPGVAVDHYREGHRYRVLISLRETKNRGDIEEFHIQRTILNGFTQPSEDLQTDVDHRTSHLSVSIVFPKNRPPKEANLVEQNTTHFTLLDKDYTQVLPDGRTQVTWKTDHPRLYESYILAWRW